MDIQLDKKENGGTFYVEKDGNKSAVMEFEVLDNVMDITHTEVQENMQGEGVGRKLVAEGKSYAEKKGYELKASCSYANKVLNG